jgi:hypothetical protein
MMKVQILKGTVVVFDVVVEIPKGERNKYEVDHKTGQDPARPDALHLEPPIPPTTGSSTTPWGWTATRSMRW